MKISDYMKETKAKIKKIENLIDDFRHKNGINPLICPHFALDFCSKNYPLTISIYTNPVVDQETVEIIDDTVAIKADEKSRELYPEQIEKIIKFIKGVEI